MVGVAPTQIAGRTTNAGVAVGSGGRGVAVAAISSRPCWSASTRSTLQVWVAAVWVQ